MFIFEGAVASVFLAIQLSPHSPLGADGPRIDAGHSEAVTGQRPAARNTRLAYGGTWPLDQKPGGAFLVSEFGQAATDLNGDGDTFDLVWHIHDAVLGTTTNTGLEVDPIVTLGTTQDLLVYGVREGTSGVGDLNGDGDATDRVVHVLDVP